MDMDFERENRNRIIRLEQKVDFLLKELGLEEKERAFASQSQPFDDVVALVRQGRKIEAIKLYRQSTGLGLKEAKEAVDQID